jgi:hypothetical protein
MMTRGGGLPARTDSFAQIGVIQITLKYVLSILFDLLENLGAKRLCRGQTAKQNEDRRGINKASVSLTRPAI